MNVTARFRHAIVEGEPLDWDRLCAELDAEHAAAQTPRGRENLLALLTIIADRVERIDTTAATLADFRADRRRIYQRLLLREASVDGSLYAQTLNMVTEREVIMGRMSQDDPMRLAAVVGSAHIAQHVDTTADRPTDQLNPPVAIADRMRGTWQRLWARMPWPLRSSSNPWRTPPANPTV